MSSDGGVMVWLQNYCDSLKQWTFRGDRYYWINFFLAVEAWLSNIYKIKLNPTVDSVRLMPNIEHCNWNSNDHRRNKPYRRRWTDEIHTRFLWCKWTRSLLSSLGFWKISFAAGVGWCNTWLIDTHETVQVNVKFNSNCIESRQVHIWDTSHNEIYLRYSCSRVCAYLYPCARVALNVL